MKTEEKNEDLGRPIRIITWELYDALAGLEGEMHKRTRPKTFSGDVRVPGLGWLDLRQRHLLMIGEQDYQDLVSEHLKRFPESTLAPIEEILRRR